MENDESTALFWDLEYELWQLNRETDGGFYAEILASFSDPEEARAYREMLEKKHQK